MSSVRLTGLSLLTAKWPIFASPATTSPATRATRSGHMVNIAFSITKQQNNHSAPCHKESQTNPKYHPSSVRDTTYHQTSTLTGHQYNSCDCAKTDIGSGLPENFEQLNLQEFPHIAEELLRIKNNLPVNACVEFVIPALLFERVHY